MRAAHAGFFSSMVRFFSGGEVDAADIETKTSVSAAIAMPLLGSSNAAQSGQAGSSGEKADLPPLLTVQDNAFVASRNPAGTLPSSSSDQITVYTVLAGDTPSSIAERFDVSLNTILWANSIRNANMIRIGDQLVILPVSGVKYEVKKGDTIESIAKQFKGDADEILRFNGLAIGELLAVGDTIIIPDGEIAGASVAVSSGTGVSRPSTLPDFVGYFLRPINGGRNVRATKANPHGLHGYNGVDLAAPLGSSVLASAEGTIIVARTSGWNGGYGRYIVIAHPNGTQTLYGHLYKVFVSAGNHIAQGAIIGSVGSSGNSTGPHVHFEIRGAKNPF